NIARAVVIADIQMQIDNLTGDATVGKAVFEKRCATCHRLQNTGKAIGADLAALKDRSTNALLIAMLDPNNAVETKFLSYTAVTANGLTFNGMLLSETGNSVTLMGTDGKEHILARTDLDELNCSNRSLMPEGLEKDLTPQDFVDVIAFVQSSGVKWKQFEGNQPQVITADADGTLTLSAAAAEIYGPSLIFERKYSNLGFWSSTRDYAVWNIDSPASGHWTVEIEYACDNATAGNPLKLSTGSRLLSARVPGTGNWDTYRTWTAGNIDLRRGRGQLILTAPAKPTFALIDLRAIRLIPPK
ncbi:MAG: c-type cytochrome, partial [Fuerstiella sp.]|nr:c-type cytochrome [Fuerstiella sp.]